MKACIRYRTSYQYEETVSLSPHTFRLLPKADTHLKVERFSFAVNGSADVQYRRDLFDNLVAICFFPDPCAELRVELEVDLDLQEKNAFHFLLASHALDLPFQYEPHERAVLAPFLQTADGPLKLPFWHLEPKPTVSALVSLNEAIHDHLQYERREEGAARVPRETLDLGRGACRDFALLLAEALRGIGVAARLASGYLWEAGASASERRAEGALHAWTEAYLPGAGWVGMDPTNGTFCNHNHITAAVGLTPDDIAPISGIYYGNHPVASSMSSALQLYSCPP